MEAINIQKFLSGEKIHDISSGHIICPRKTFRQDNIITIAATMPRPSRLHLLNAPKWNSREGGEGGMSLYG